MLDLSLLPSRSARLRAWVARRAPHRLVTVLAFGLLAAVSGCGHPDLSQEPGAVAGCEAPGPGDLDPQPIMLPGRRCAACHDKGHQAGNR